MSTWILQLNYDDYYFITIYEKKTHPVCFANENKLYTDAKLFSGAIKSY